MVGACRECNGKVSSDAEACPHCGIKTGKANAKATTWKDVVIIAVVMVGFMGMIGLVVWFFAHLSNKV